jgi:DnaK suppressor protein
MRVNPKPASKQDKMSMKILKWERDLLKKLRKELRERINKGGELKSLQGSDIGDLTAFDANNYLSISFASQYAKNLKEINHALKKIKEGTYGYCEECGERIAQKRLTLIPYALYCVPCQSMIEAEKMWEDEEADPFHSPETETMPL